MTNDDCEVFPGPRLNIVIGPNGTGKSTLTHAICLACCGTTGDIGNLRSESFHLMSNELKRDNYFMIGRSSDLSKFVKHGKEGQECFVEVDIVYNSGTVRIRRTLNSENRGSKWSMNGKACTQTDVKKFVVGKLSIDVDNLCSFMPQDKVGNFTQFTPKEVLENTLKSITINDEGRTLRDEQMELADVESIKMDLRRDLNLQKGALEAGKVELRGLEVEKERMRQRNEDKASSEVNGVRRLCASA